MGRNFRQGRQRNRRNEGRKPQQDDRDTRPYNLQRKENESFEKFYKAQGIVPEDEWNLFMTTLRQPLPATFRITGFKGQSKELLKMIKSEYFDKMANIDFEGRVMDPPKCLPWYPEELGWQLNFDRKFIRQCEPLKKLHNFLVEETESGNISRQEAVSMIPPLVMGIESHHKVLDMCAAPGSKTAQLIEMLHSCDDPVPEGCVVANDSDNKRCYLMTHQVKRLESPSFLIVNQDATCMPNFKLPNEEGHQKPVKFDRILADVPCSGDGTLRKNVDAWGKWNINTSMHLHNIQSRILCRGLEMLAIGGRLVYSTCSLNPIEDEAVLSNILRKSKDTVRLVDIAPKLSELKSVPGLSSWKVLSKNFEEFTAIDEVPARLQSIIRPSLFPPSEEEAEKFNLHYCLRILPHHQDTGGFFLSLLEKVDEVPWVTKSKLHKKEEGKNASTTKEDGVTMEKSTECNNKKTDETTKANSEEITDVEAEEMTEVKREETAEVKSEETTEVKNEKPTEVKSEKPTEVKSEKPTEVKSEEPTEVKSEETTEVRNEEVKVESTEGLSEEHVKETAEGKENPVADLEQKNSNHEEMETGSNSTDKRKREGGDSPPTKRGKLTGFKEDPFVFIDENDAIWPPVQDFFKLKDFPVDQLLVRCIQGKKRNLYFASPIVKSLVTHNMERMKFINLGLKVLSRSDSPHSPCSYRAVQEGVAVLFPHVKTRIVPIKKDDIITLLRTEMPYLTRFSKELNDGVEGLGQGSVIFKYDPDLEEPDCPKCQMLICGWLGRTSCRSFIAINERGHYLRLCGSELQSKEERRREQLEFQAARLEAKGLVDKVPVDNDDKHNREKLTEDKSSIFDTAPEDSSGSDENVEKEEATTSSKS